ncbi:MAG TPA: TonB-dependent receptor [Gemmatimonadaceae bacterium]|nr:TonB-dependent receptor [Gemmatimonadaceae bacterium]
MLVCRAHAVLVAASVAFVANAGAQDSLPRRLPPVVTVTRDVGRSPLDLPYAITSLRPDSLSPGLTHTLVEQTLALLPGVTVANRTNPSQDTRVSIRGFGARSQFGARSIRVLRDGMPLTLPDGQTPIDYLDLESVGRVEVIRGAAASLYGNAAGGVVDLRSVAAPPVPFALQARTWSGPDANPVRNASQQRFAALFGGTMGRTSYQGNIGRTHSDGYRTYAHQQLTNAFARAATTVGSTEIGLVGLGLDMPLAENPGALTAAQFNANPRQADALSVQKKARKTVHQVQIGLSARQPLAHDGEVSAQVYGGTRTLFNPLTFAVVGVDRHQSGAAARLTLPFAIDGLENRVSVGADAQWLNDARKNWANCNAVPTANASCPSLPNEKGNLTLDQRELVSSLGPYVRDELEHGRWRLTAGVRADQVRFEVRDHFLADGRDDSGNRTLHAVSPMFGLAARLSSFHSLYANVGSAFETPTTTELGNQADGTAGLNRDLKPQYSTTYETGAKGVAGRGVQYDVALFDTEVRDELIPFEVPGGNGRTYYRNAGRTRRRGAEVGLGADVGPVSLTGAYTLSNFRFRNFLNGTVQYAGNTIPGVPEHQVQASATWRVGRAYLLAEGIAKSRVFVNDANTLTQLSVPCPGSVGTTPACRLKDPTAFSVFNARVGGTAVFGRPWLSPVIGVQNLFDKHYVGSVAVNAAGATPAATKFYEPAAARTWFVGLSAATNPW